MKNKGPNMAKWKDYRLELLQRARDAEEAENDLVKQKENLTEHFLGVKTMKPINRNAPEIQENAQKAVNQIEEDLEKMSELLEIAKKGLNEGKVPESTLGNGIMQLAARVGAVAGQMWK